MRLRDQVALTLPSLILRVMLAVIFIWTGAIKVFTTTELAPPHAAALANLGVDLATATPDAPAPATPDPLPDPALDADPDAGPGADPDAEPADSSATSDRPGDLPAEPLREPTSHTDAGDAGDAAPFDRDVDITAAPGILLTAWQPDAGAVADAAADAAPEADPETDPGAMPAPPPPPATATDRVYTPADFPQGARARAVYRLALVLDTAANPPLDDQSNQPEPFWPEALGDGHWPVTLAWAVAIGEVLCGVALLVGLFARLAGLGIASIMLGAMWLTEFGPALQAGTTHLGFFPGHELADIAAWTKLWFQFALFCASLAVFLLGAGPIGLDRAIFRRPRLGYDTEPSYAPADEHSKRPPIG